MNKVYKRTFNQLKLSIHCPYESHFGTITQGDTCCQKERQMLSMENSYYAYK